MTNISGNDPDCDRCKMRVPTEHPLMLNALTHHGPCVSFLVLLRCSATNWMTSNTLSLPSHRSRSWGLGPGCPRATAPPGTPGEDALLPLTVSAASGALGWGSAPQPQPPSLHHCLTFTCPSVLSHLCLNPPRLTRTAFICAGWRPMLMTSPFIDTGGEAFSISFEGTQSNP